MKKFFLFLVLVLPGCGIRSPDIIGDCEIAPYKQMWEEKGKTVEDCKMAVLKKEDRAAKKQAYYDKIAGCKAQGLVAFETTRGTKRYDPNDIECISDEDFAQMMQELRRALGTY